MLRELLLGAAAGAAGTTALNSTTYLDMAWRGRPASSTPQRTVERMAQARHVDIPGKDGERENRLEGLAPLSGVATGVGVGVAYAMLDVLHLRPGRLLGSVVAGGGAMLVSNATMTAYGVTDPRTWGMSGWLMDVVPHLAYGAVVAMTYDAARGR